MAVCLLPRTEIAFDENVECDSLFGGILTRKIGQRLARFRQINVDPTVSHRDTLEFPDGQVVSPACARASARPYCNCRPPHILRSQRSH